MFLNQLKQKNALTVQIHHNISNNPTFNLEERLVNLIGRKEHFVGLSLISLCLVLYCVNKVLKIMHEL